MPKNDDEMPRRWREHEIQQAQFTNGETGEVIAGTLTGLVPQQSRRRKKRKEIKFAMIDIEAMPKLVMSKGEWSLFWAVVSYTDPYVPTLELGGHALASIPFEAAMTTPCDCAVVATDHAVFDYARIGGMGLLVDTRDAIKTRGPNVFSI